MSIKHHLLFFIFICSCIGGQAFSHALQVHPEIIEFHSNRSTQHLLLPMGGEVGQIWRDNSDTSLTVTNCANADWYCLNAGVISILAPKDCGKAIFDKWVNLNVSAKFIKQDGNLFYYKSITGSETTVPGPYNKFGYVYSRERGVVAIWFGKYTNDNEIGKNDLDVLWISPDNTPFMKCNSFERE